MKRLLHMAGLIGLLLLPCAPLQAQDSEYVRIYDMIRDADALLQSGRARDALEQYTLAHRELERFRRVHPDWNERVVTFRMNYLAAHIAEASKQAPPLPPTQPAMHATNAPPPAVPAQRDAAELENQIVALQNQLRQLQTENQSLTAKLKEALAARPAAVDPRELTRAEERIRDLEKENSLLQVALARQQKETRTPAPDQTALVDQLKQELARANQSLASQTAKTDALMLETHALQIQLTNASAAPKAEPELGPLRQALEEANRKLAAQTQLASTFSAEKDRLQTRLAALETDAETKAALVAENAILKRQLAELKKPAPAASDNDPVRRLAQAQARIAALESDTQILRLEKIALEGRVKQLLTPQTGNAVGTPSAPVENADAARIQALELERADLQKKLQAAQNELYGRKRKSAAARIDDLSKQLQELHARLAVYEARQVPYSDAELALFKPGGGSSSLAGAKPASSQASRILPEGTATLVAEARRDFAAKQFAQAEQKYLQVLRKDESNVYTLANLATIQLELGRLDEAEKHVRQALALSSDDVYSLGVLGQIQFRRQQYEPALDSLSRAATLDPHDAEIQNFLGLTLSQKGMRQAAETAFRKSIQINPDYPGAHYNLAVFYATQKPPWPELARWHYRKALDKGFTRNPDLEKLLDQPRADAAGR